jgi:hypothetical protein
LQPSDLSQLRYTAFGMRDVLDDKVMMPFVSPFFAVWILD